MRLLHPLVLSAALMLAMPAAWAQVPDPGEGEAAPPASDSVASPDAPDAAAPERVRLPVPGLLRGERYVDGRIAFLKAELKLNSGQEDAFKPVEAAMRAAADSWGNVQSHLGRRPTLIARMQQRQAALAAELDAVKALNAALGPFYDALSEEQKARADVLFTMLP